MYFLLKKLKSVYITLVDLKKCIIYILETNVRILKLISTDGKYQLLSQVSFSCFGKNNYYST